MTISQSVRLHLLGCTYVRIVQYRGDDLSKGTNSKWIVNREIGYFIKDSYQGYAGGLGCLVKKTILSSFLLC